MEKFFSFLHYLVKATFWLNGSADKWCQLVSDNQRITRPGEKTTTAAASSPSPDTPDHMLLQPLKRVPVSLGGCGSLQQAPGAGDVDHSRTSLRRRSALLIDDGGDDDDDHCRLVAVISSSSIYSTHVAVIIAPPVSTPLQQALEGSSQ